MVSVTFGRPEYLWLLVIIPLLVIGHFWFLRHAKRNALKFANFAAIKRATGERLITKNYTVLVLRIVIIICAILATSQTTLWRESMTSQNEYVIAIDTSASMTAQDVTPTRLDAAKTYGEKFISELDENTRVGIVSFSGVTFIEETMTSDKEKLKEALVPIESTASGTDIPGAIITSVNILTTTEKGRAMILISDGSNTIETFQSKSLQRSIEYAKLHHVQINTIGVGRKGGVALGYLPTYYNVSSTYDEDNLQYISNVTGGKYYLAADNNSLAMAYDDIRKESNPGQVKKDLTGIFTLCCMFFLLIEWVLLNTRFRSLP